MSRFLKIRVSKDTVRLEELAARAKVSLLLPDSNRGFEVETLTRERLVLRWFEKVVIERRIDAGAFAGTSFSEVRIITFGLIIDSSAKNVLLVDPPLGKERVHATLRLLFTQANFRFLNLDVKATIEQLVKNGAGRVSAIETDPVAAPRGVMMAMKVSGGDVLAYIARKLRGYEFDLRAAAVEITSLSVRPIQAVLMKGGLVKLASRATHPEIEAVAQLMKYRE